MGAIRYHASLTRAVASSKIVSAADLVARIEGPDGKDEGAAGTSYAV